MGVLNNLAQLVISDQPFLQKSLHTTESVNMMYTVQERTEERTEERPAEASRLHVAHSHQDISGKLRWPVIASGSM